MNELVNYNDFQISYTVLGMIQNNVFVVKSAGEVAVIDPSSHCNKIIELAGTSDISKILITHYHFDHVGAANDLREQTGAKTYASKVDKWNIEHSEDSPVPHWRIKSCPVDVQLGDGDVVKIGNSDWKVIETPGHTPGGICFYCDNAYEKPLLICGDTLFRHSCGRTDFADGSMEDLRMSLAKLAKLPDETLVFPGHDAMTTIAEEHNYLLR